MYPDCRQWFLVSQPVKVSSVPAAIKVVNETIRAYPFAPAGEAKLTNSTEVQNIIPGFIGILKSAFER